MISRGTVPRLMEGLWHGHDVLNDYAKKSVIGAVGVTCCSHYNVGITGEFRLIVSAGSEVFGCGEIQAAAVARSGRT